MIPPLSGNSARWLAALSYPQMIISAHVDVLKSGIVTRVLPVQDGTVTMDRTAAVRRQCSLNVIPDLGPSGLDTSWRDDISAAGDEIRPWWQITYPDGSTDEVSLGTFTIVDSEAADVGTDVTVKITGYDRSWLLQQDQLSQPYVSAPSIPVEQAIQDLINSQWSGPALSYNIAPSGHLTPSTGFIAKPGKTVWSQALVLAASIGYDLSMDPYGGVQGAPVPDPTVQAPVATLTALQRSGLKTATSTSTRKGVYSSYSIIATGSVQVMNKAGTKLISKSTPIYSQAKDENPNSPTYYVTFGTVNKTIRSSVITTSEQGLAAAQGYLRAQQGAMTALGIEIIPFPLLDAFDVITVNPGRVAPQGNYVIDGWQASLKYDASMALTIRQVIQ